MKYIPKKEKISYYAGLSGQNMVYALIGGSFSITFLPILRCFPQ